MIVWNFQPMSRRHIMRKTFIFISFLTFILLSGCNQSQSENENLTVKEEKQLEEVVSKEMNKVEDELVEDVDDNNTLNENLNDEESEFDDDRPKQGDYNIYIGGEVIETDDKIIIHGESNLIPGSRVVGEVSVGKNVRYFIRPKVEDYDFLADTTELVDENGNFYMEIEHPGLHNETEVTVKFHFDGQQNEDVIRHYGDRGQNLEGPYIYKHQGEVGGRGPDNIYKKAEVKTSFIPGEEKAVRHFSEPEWYTDIDDIGNPRVWIEVEEINDDGEYFYIHGRSNLIEGSRISIKRKNSQKAETLVKPDGSFHFKFDYEYEEDAPFVIEFDPSDFQWNIVEETYGAKGQKLVGNLVETNKFNNKQFIQYEVELQSREIDVPENVDLEIDGSEVTMLVPDDILFDFDKYDLKDDAKKTLEEISETLQNSFNKKELNITINGHTDNIGSKQYNEKLSKQRADEVKKYLESLLQDSNITFKTEGYGDTKPIASNDTEEGQAKNRRVEIVIDLK